MIKIVNTGTASSGTHWVQIEKEIDGFILRGILRVTETLFNTLKVGEELTLPKTVEETVKWE